jgi:hypothetical protein
MAILTVMVVNKEELIAPKPLYNIPPVMKIGCGDYQPPSRLENPAALAQKEFRIDQVLN